MVLLVLTGIERNLVNFFRQSTTGISLLHGQSGHLALTSRSNSCLYVCACVCLSVFYHASAFLGHMHVNKYGDKCLCGFARMACYPSFLSCLYLILHS